MSELPAEFSLPIDAFERQRRLLRREIAPPRHSNRRRIAVAAAVGIVVLLCAVVATPARGVGGRLLDLIQGTLAPPEVQTYFTANEETRKHMLAYEEQAGAILHGRFSPVIASQARGLFAIKSVDGPIYLWAAPTEDGRQCWLIQVGTDAATGSPRGIGTCEEHEETGAIVPDTTWWADLPDVVIVHARVYDDAITQVDVEVEDAPTVVLPVVGGHALGTIPKGERALAMVGRDQSGSEVARYTIAEAKG
jgi:hypothetical protein